MNAATEMQSLMEKPLRRAAQHSGVDDATFDATLLADARRMEECVGRLLFASRYAGQPSAVVHHGVASIEFAADALAYLKARGKTRTWSAPVGGSAAGAFAWSRSVWRVALSLPVGYIVSDHVMRASTQGPGWNPALQDLAGHEYEYALETSNRPVAPLPISLQVHMRLFGYTPLVPDPLMWLAVLDTFSEKPNRDNPVADAIGHALQLLVAECESLPFPYWWHDFANHRRLGTREQSRFLPRPGATGGGAAAEVLSSLNRRPESPSVPPAVAPPAAPAEPPPPPSPSAPAAPSVAVPTTIATAVDAPASAGSAPGTDDAAVEEAFAALRHVIRTGALLVNGARATFHVLNGRLHIVWPGGWERLATHCGRNEEPPRERGERLYAALAAGGWLERDDVSGDLTPVYFAHPPGRESRRAAAMLRLNRFSSGAQARLFPAGIPFSDNTDLLRSKVRPA